MTVLALAAAAVTSAPAYGANLAFTARIDDAGGPVLYAQSFPDTGAEAHVSSCAAGGTACEALAVTSTGLGKPVKVVVGDVAPGTVFDASYVKDGAVLAAGRSPAWLGRVTSTAPPVLTGDPATGSTVSMTPGTWSGGWDAPWGSRSAPAIYACTDASAADCFLVSYGTPLKIEARWAGWHLLGAESHFSASNYGIAGFMAPPVHIGPLPRAQLSARSKPLGPIDGAATPREQVRYNGGVPYVSIRPRATRHGDRLTIGRVTCVRCTVAFTAAGTRRTLRVRGTKVLTIPARGGRFSVRVDVNGKRVSSGTTRAG